MDHGHQQPRVVLYLEWMAVACLPLEPSAHPGGHRLHLLLEGLLQGKRTSLLSGSPWSGLASG